MYKKHLLQNIEREILLTKQLAAIITEKDLQLKPVEHMRSVHELMIYLSYIGELATYWTLNKDMTPDERKAMREANMHVTIADFPNRLDKQWANIQALLKDVTDEQLFANEAVLPWKEKMDLGAAIINGPIKFLASYRMQLFNHLKTNGRPEMGTKEAWMPAA